MMQSEDKLCVVVLFGGMSSEHEVSRVSAGTFVDQLDRQRYELLTIGITKEGRWLYTEADSAQMADGSWEELPGNMPCVLSPDRADHGLILFTPAGQVEKVHVDVVIPVLHGLWGEDGTVQGLLELAGIPYVGCGVLASAVCMDKAVANAMFDASGIPHTKWLSATRWEIESDPDGVCDGVIAKLGWPIFVKPANAGSSVGITKAHDRDELKAAIRLALANDRKVVFEAFVDGHEVECAVIGLPAGLGDPMLDGMENRIARLAFAIPAVKGVAFGAGFAVADRRGSQNNDPFYFDEAGQVRTRTNHAGGILGGITNGMPLVFQAAVKPTPSIGQPQESVSLSRGENTTLVIHGRHDPCIVPRAVPCLEAAAAIAVYDAWLEQQKRSNAK